MTGLAGACRRLPVDRDGLLAWLHREELHDFVRAPRFARACAEAYLREHGPAQSYDTGTTVEGARLQKDPAPKGG